MLIYLYRCDEKTTLGRQEEPSRTGHLDTGVVFVDACVCVFLMTSIFAPLVWTSLFLSKTIPEPSHFGRQSRVCWLVAMSTGTWNSRHLERTHHDLPPPARSPRPLQTTSITRPNRTRATRRVQALVKRSEKRRVRALSGGEKRGGGRSVLGVFFGVCQFSSSFLLLLGAELRSHPCSRMRSEGFSFNSGGQGVEPCSRLVV